MGHLPMKNKELMAVMVTACYPITIQALTNCRCFFCPHEPNFLQTSCVRQNEFEKQDERNVAIAEKAKAKVYDLFVAMLIKLS